MKNCQFGLNLQSSSIKNLQFWHVFCFWNTPRKSTTVPSIENQIKHNLGPSNHGIVLTPQVWWHLPTKQLALHQTKHVVPTMPLPVRLSVFYFNAQAAVNPSFCISPFLKINTQLPPGSSVCEITYSKKVIECVPPYQLTKFLKPIGKPGLGGRQTTNNSKFWRHGLWTLLIDISPDRQQVTRGFTRSGVVEPPNHSTESRQHSSLLLKACAFVGYKTENTL